MHLINKNDIIEDPEEPQLNISFIIQEPPLWFYF